MPSNPWDDFALNHKEGDKVKGQIQSIHPIRRVHRPWMEASTDWCICRTCPDTARRRNGTATTRRATKSKLLCLIDVERERIYSHQAVGRRSVRWFCFRPRRAQWLQVFVKSWMQRVLSSLWKEMSKRTSRLRSVGRSALKIIRNHLKEGNSVTAVIINVDRRIAASLCLSALIDRRMAAISCDPR